MRVSSPEPRREEIIFFVGLIQVKAWQAAILQIVSVAW
jgi:hypothetical protein